MHVHVEKLEILQVFSSEELAGRLALCHGFLMRPTLFTGAKGFFAGGRDRREELGMGLEDVDEGQC